MSRLNAVFKEKKKVLNIYCTAGFPQLNDTLEAMKAVQDAGADIIELGIPYSDPLADGPVIQQSSAQALKNGMNLKLLFQQLKDFRKSIRLPVILMGYLNSVLQYGFEKFCADAAALGIDGLILPDVPLYEYEAFYKPIIQKHNLDFIFLVTPETSDARIRLLDDASTGFLYAVSSSSTTGSAKDFGAASSYLQKLQNMHLKNPVMVGFGIHNKETFDAACMHAAGGIIGSAYIKALQQGGDIYGLTKNFIQTIRPS